MPVIKMDRDIILDKVYECRSKIDFSNNEAIKAIGELVGLIIHSPESDNQSMFPKIKISR